MRMWLQTVKYDVEGIWWHSNYWTSGAFPPAIRTPGRHALCLRLTTWRDGWLLGNGDGRFIYREPDGERPVYPAAWWTPSAGRCCGGLRTTSICCCEAIREAAERQVPAATIAAEKLLMVPRIRVDMTYLTDLQPLYAHRARSPPPSSG